MFPVFPKKGPMFPCSNKPTYRGTWEPFSEKGSYVLRNLSIFTVDSQHGQQAFLRMAHLEQQPLSGYFAVHLAF